MKRTKIMVLVLILFTVFPSIVNSQTKKSLAHISEWIKGEKINLNNKTIIIEFWATWCQPCIGSIPHINELSQKFSSDSVIFLSMTSFDTKEKVEAFLQKNNFKTYVVIDDDKKTYEELEIPSMPKTLIINPQNEIIWKGDPGQLTAKKLKLYLSKKVIPTVDLQNPYFFNFNISYAYDRDVSKTSYTGGNPEKIDFINKDLENIIQQIFSLPMFKNNQYHFKGESPIEPRVNLNYATDTSYNKTITLHTLMRNLSLIYHFEIDTIAEEQDLYELTSSNKSKNNNDTATFYFEKKENEYKFHHISLNKLKKELTKKLGIIVKIKGPPKQKIDCIIYENDIDKTTRSLKGINIFLTPKKISTLVWTFTFK